MAVVGIPILENLYMTTMDMWPVEAKEFNRNYLFYEYLKEGRFTTTKCQNCGYVAYPPRIICPECYSDNLNYIDLPTRGRVIVFSEEVKGVPLGFEPPLIHAVVDLGVEPVRRLLTRIINCPAGYLKRGDEVELAVFDVPEIPIEKGKTGPVMVKRVFFAFTPVKS